jgi:hypothetical protein
MEKIEKKIIWGIKNLNKWSHHCDADKGNCVIIIEDDDDGKINNFIKTILFL